MEKFLKLLMDLGWVIVDGEDYCPMCAERIPLGLQEKMNILDEETFNKRYSTSGTYIILCAGEAPDASLCPNFATDKALL